MASTDVLATLRELVTQNFDVSAAPLQDDVPFTALGLDSLDLADFMFKAEDSFGVTIDYAQAMQAPTLAGLAALIEGLQATASPASAALREAA